MTTLDLALRAGGALRLEAPAGGGMGAFCFAAEGAGAEGFYGLLGALCRAAGQPFLNLDEALHARGLRVGDLAPEAWRDLADLRGYAVAASAPELWRACAAASPMRRAVFLRDPRDVAVAAYARSGAAGEGATLTGFLSGPELDDILESYRIYLSPPRAPLDLRLRYEHALDGWREIAADLVAFLGLPLSARQARSIADATPALSPRVPDLHTRDATIQALIDLNGCAELVEQVMGFALEALGCPESPTLWRIAESGPVARSIRRAPPSPPDPVAGPSTGVGEPDPVLYHRLRANVWMERDIGGRRIKLETDEFGRRVTLGQPATGERLVAIYGCSFTFGTTSTADETFCSLLQGMLPKWRIENHGVGGYSQSRNLIALERESRFNPADLVAFCWIRDHLRRNVADIGWVQATSKGVVEQAGGQPRVAPLPRAGLDAQGELAMGSVRYPRADFDGLDFAEYEPSPYYLDQVCFKLFERANALVEGYGGRFFVVDLHGGMSPALTAMLATADIPLVKTLFRAPQYFATPTDPHPNALAHQIYAQKIYEYIASLA